MSTQPKTPITRTPLERAPRVDFGTHRIPKEKYLSRAVAEREWDAMWRKVWLFAGFERDIPNPGDYFTFEIGRESALVIRQTDGSIAAKYNVCSHRGNRLREPGLGHARQFACGYHDWRFGIDGRLEAPQDPETFRQGCPIEELSLQSIRCERWGGFVWISLDPDARPLRDYLGVLPSHLDPYHLEEMSILNDYTIEVGCNWKTSVDAFNEAYHIAGTHPDTLGVNDDVNVPIDCYDLHSRMILQLAVASPRHPEHGKVHSEIREHFMATAGVDIEAFSGGVEDARRAIVKSIREVQGPALGADFSELRDEQLIDDFHYTIFPNVTLNIFGRSAWLFRHRPHPDDPERMYFDFFNILRAPAAAIARPEHEFHVATDDLVLAPVGGGGELLAQDTYNLPRVQAGMRSAGFRGLHLGEQEIRLRHFHATLDGYLSESSGKID